MGRRKPKKEKKAVMGSVVELVWLRAAYHFHTYAYRDPRSAFSSAIGLPVVSPTTVLLGIASTLFNLGKAYEAQSFLEIVHRCRVAVDAPNGVVFFRAFHQLRRYHTNKYGPNPKLGLTNINQGTREYGLVDGNVTLFVGVPDTFEEAVKLALLNRDHLGTHDSLCSLVGSVERCDEPVEVVYLPPEKWQTQVPEGVDITTVTLSRFKNSPLEPTLKQQDDGIGYWWMAGGKDTELVPYMIKGRFFGTSCGKVFKKS